MAAAIGILLIAVSVVLYSSAAAFPGPAALPPVAGAVLIIYAGTATRETLVARALSLRPVAFVGLISYSLYLWHWPVLVFARIWRGEVLTPGEAALCIVLSIVLAVLSWRFIEAPFREHRVCAARAPLFRTAGAAMAAMIAFGVFANANARWPQRHEGYDPPAIPGMDRMNLATCFLKDSQTAADWAGAETCRRGAKDGPLVFVWGDSFAAHLIPGLADELGARFQIVQYTAGGCPPVLGIDLANRPHCRTFNDRALEQIARKKPDIVLVSARWDLYRPRIIGSHDIRATFDRLSETGTRIVAVGASPTFDFASPYDYVYRNGSTDARANPQPSIADDAGPITVVDPAPLFCNGALCRLTGDDGFLFFDGGHYSVEGSRRVARALGPVFDAQIAEFKAAKFRKWSKVCPGIYGP